MSILKKFILLVSFLYITGCTTVGPKIVIETNEPAEDFVVLCQKTKSHLFAIGENVREIVVDKVIVTESGKEVDCGIMLGGSNGRVSITHPILTGDGKQNYVRDGVKHIVMNKTQLDLLYEKKVKFEAGEWDKYRNPNSEYARSFGTCGFGYEYLKYYSKERQVQKDYFFKKYNDFLLDCNQKVYEEVYKHDPIVANRSFSVDKTMKRIWSKDRWGESR